MPKNKYKTRDGRDVVITKRDHAAPGTLGYSTTFTVIGTMDGVKSCWTAEGKYRIDGRVDDRDIMNFDEGETNEKA